MAPTSKRFSPELRTERLSLFLYDVFNETHNTLFLSFLNDPVALEKNGDWNIRTGDDIRTLAAIRALHEDNRGPNAPYPCTYLFRLGHESTDPVIGSINLWQGPKALMPDVGWGLRHEYAGNGYATEAARAALQHWRFDMGINDIAVTTGTEHVASERIAQKLGFVLNGIAVDHGDRKVNIFTTPDVKKLSHEELVSIAE